MKLTLRQSEGEIQAAIAAARLNNNFAVRIEHTTTRKEAA